MTNALDIVIWHSYLEVQYCDNTDKMLIDEADSIIKAIQAPKVTLGINTNTNFNLNTSVNTITLTGINRDKNANTNKFLCEIKFPEIW